MRAVVLTGHGGFDKLAFADDWPAPEPAAEEVLIEVGACGVNNTDVNTRTGWYAPQVDTASSAGADGGFGVEEGGWSEPVAFPRIQGADICGRVAGLGEGVRADVVGQRVLVDPWLRNRDDPAAPEGCGYLGSERDGGFADYVSVPFENVYVVESPLSDVELASFPTPALTAENMLERAQVAESEIVLVTGASGGVGTALVQGIRRRGATPIAVCSRDKAEAVRALGAAAVIERDTRELEAALRRGAGLDRIDVVADVVGGPGWRSLIQLLRRGGRYVCSGAIAGPIVELDLRTIYLNDLTLFGATVPPPHLFGKLIRAIESQAFQPVVAATFPLEQVPAAQELFLAKGHVGNIVIDVSGSRPSDVTRPGSLGET
jgi:NADPH:quinone reductase-like Zn-dependent oxidoreductase